MNGDPEPQPPPLLSAVTLTNVGDLVSRHATRRPDVVALVQPGPDGTDRRQLTWSELDDQVSALASGLAGQGLVGGHRVALCGANSIEFVLAYFAVVRAGFVASQIFGLVVTRYILKIEPVASLGVEELAATIGPTIDRYLTMPVDHLPQAVATPNSDPTE